MSPGKAKIGGSGGKPLEAQRISTIKWFSFGYNISAATYIECLMGSGGKASGSSEG